MKGPAALKKVLADHRLWLESKGEKGRQADLTSDDIIAANLIYATMTFADLTCATGVAHPPVKDPRGYRCIAVAWSDGWQIFAGCHSFTLAEAREHWGVRYSGIRGIGDAYLFALDWLEKQPLPV